MVEFLEKIEFYIKKENHYDKKCLYLHQVFYF